MAIREEHKQHLLDKGQVVDSYTTADGTTYQAVISTYATGIVKTTTNEDGTTTTTIVTANEGARSKTKRDRFGNKTGKTGGAWRQRQNTANISMEFDKFKDAATAAENTTETLGYDDSNLTVGGSGFLRADKKTNLNIVDSSGNVVGSVGGSIGSDAEEVANAKTLANEIINISDNDLGRYLSMHLKAIRNDNSNKGVRANYRAILRELRRRDK